MAVMSVRLWLCSASGGLHIRCESRVSQGCLSQWLETAQHTAFLFHLSLCTGKKDCQVSSLRFWPEKSQNNGTTVCLVTTLWLQFHIVDCDGQCLSAPLKHPQAWFSFLLLYTTLSAAVNPFVPSHAKLVSTEQMSSLGLWVGSPLSITSATGKIRMQWEGFFWETEFEAITSVTVMFVSLSTC